MPSVPVYDPDRYGGESFETDLAVGALGNGEVRDITPDYEFDQYTPLRHLHPGPLGFVDVTHRPRRKK